MWFDILLDVFGIKRRTTTKNIQVFVCLFFNQATCGRGQRGSVSELLRLVRTPFALHPSPLGAVGDSSLSSAASRARSLASTLCDALALGALKFLHTPQIYKWHRTIARSLAHKRTVVP